MTTEDWKLENHLCRCCHSEGIFTNLAEPCVDSGQEEIYTDMLRDCLDINLAPVPGALCTATYTICDACVIRLRDACNFKQQVLECEKQFKDMYSRNIITVGDSNSKIEVKIEIQDDNSDDLKDELSDNEHIKAHIEDDFDDTCETNFNDEDLETLEMVKKKSTKAVKSKKPARKPASSRKRKKNTDVEATDVPEKKKGRTVTCGYYILSVNEDGTKLFTCSTCSRTYKTLGSVSQHHRHVHLRLRPKLRSCHLCEIKVPGYSRAQHLEKEHGIPAPTCGACGKKFGYPFQVLRHQKIFHMGERKFKCGVCDKMFATHSSLEQHEKTHSSIREYTCKYCEKSFKWRKNLRTHIMMHENDRRQVCKICGEMFVQQSSLKYHMIKRHPETV